ncbi:Putative nuclease HARBI1 [Trachymyrmex septentrionalis]|uniref:Putative nuclease HARBI1 n=1 Tax=Trachymyrmex septentrionalis TaxID=34720 RepID=A0A195FTQ5_9HYME|nr:Putative nuclease HARBI1 [Trachymyrmex septentrionalis]
MAYNLVLSSSDHKDIIEQFNRRCTHIRVQSFGGEDAKLFRNRKYFFFLNTQVTCNSNLEITDIGAHWQGSVHDNTIFNNNRLRANFENGTYDSLLLGDSAYPLIKYLLTPLINSQTAAEQFYNKYTYSYSKYNRTSPCFHYQHSNNEVANALFLWNT